MAQPIVPEAPRTLVGEIRVEGLLSWDEAELIGRLNLQVGEAYDQLLEREDIVQLSRIMRRVVVIRELMPGDRIRVIFRVEEFPRLRSLQIIGNSAVKTERIETIVGLETGDIIEETNIRSIRRAIRNDYSIVGRPDTIVNVRLSIVAAPEPLPGEPAEYPQADLQIIIEEGEQIRIDDVRIEGNDEFSTIFLKLLMATKGSFLFIKNYYDDEAFEDDLVRLRALYSQHGYFDALIERGTFVERRDKKGRLVVTPVVRIEEGGVYRFGRVDVRGARLFSRDEILGLFDDLVGKDYDGKKFNRALQQVEAMYYDSGFLTTGLDREFKYDTENQSIEVTLEIDEKNRIYVGNILLDRPRYEIDEAPGFFQRFYERAAPPVSDEAIMREVMLEPGFVYSKSKERETGWRLDRMGVFSKVAVINQPTANPVVHDVLISIEEGSTGNFFTGFGLGDASGLFASISLTERNLFGEARDLSLQAQIGSRASSATVRYFDRHFRDTDDTFEARIFYNTFNRSGYRETVAGINSEITRRLYGDWIGSLRGRLEFVSLSERSGTEADEDLDDSYPVLTARLDLIQDSRFPRDRPVEGRKLAGALEAGFAGGPLLKFTAEGDYVYSLGGGLSYHFNPKFGLIPYSSSAVGLTERFFLGGNDDLRGFKFRGAGRRDSDEDKVGIGGAVKLLARNELHFPIYDPVSGVFFLDAGTLGKNPFSYEVPRVSTGFGVRFVVPPRTNVAVDFAVPILQDGDDQNQFVHFSFQGSLGGFGGFGP